MKKHFLLFLAIVPLTTQAAFHVKSSGKDRNFLYEQDSKAMASSVQVVVRSGSMVDPKGKEGLAKLSFNLMIRGTKQKTRQELVDTLEQMGGSLEVLSGTANSYFSLSVVSDNLEPAMKLLAETVQSPGLREEDFNYLKEETLARLNQEKSNNGALLKRITRQALYAGSNMAFPAEGTIESVKQLTLADVKDFLAKAVQSGNIVFAIASNHPEKEVRGWIDRDFSKISDGPGLKAKAPQFAKLKGRKVYLLDRKGSSTTEVAMAHQGVAANYPQRDILDVGMFIFGSEATSRLFTVLREENGWTYGAYARYNMLDNPNHFLGTFLAYVFPQKEHTAEATLKMIEMYEDFVKNGVKKEELEFAQNSLGNSYPFRFATSQTRLHDRLYQLLEGAPIPSVAQYRKTIQGIQPKSLLKEIQKVHDDKNFVIVLVGDPEQTQPLAKKIPGVTEIKTIQDTMAPL